LPLDPIKGGAFEILYLRKWGLKTSVVKVILELLKPKTMMAGVVVIEIG
jgi:hypothetical protein